MQASVNKKHMNKRRISKRRISKRHISKRHISKRHISKCIIILGLSLCCCVSCGKKEKEKEKEKEKAELVSSIENDTESNIAENGRQDSFVKVHDGSDMDVLEESTKSPLMDAITIVEKDETMENIYIPEPVKVGDEYINIELKNDGNYDDSGYTSEFSSYIFNNYMTHYQSFISAINIICEKEQINVGSLSISGDALTYSDDYEDTILRIQSEKGEIMLAYSDSYQFKYMLH